MTWKILEGDCQKLLPEIPTGSIDFTHLDPPYYPGQAQYIKSYRRTQGKGHISSDEIDWDLLARELYRVSAPNSVLGVWGQYPWLGKQAVHFEKAGFKPRCEIVWVKTVPNLVVKWSRPLSAHEDFWIMLKGKSVMDLHRTSTRTIVRKPNPFMTTGHRVAGAWTGKTAPMHQVPRVTGSGYLRSAIFAESMHGSNPEYLGHPTQKPVIVTTRILQLCTRPGARVLDPMCGSGTTILTAEMMGRESIGIELNPRYAKVGTERLTAWKPHAS